jgi:hypothetical protein
MKTLHFLRRIQCAVRTAGLHELEINTGCCMHCRRAWSDLYPLRGSRTKPIVPGVPSAVDHKAPLAPMTGLRRSS